MINVPLTSSHMSLGKNGVSRIRSVMFHSELSPKISFGNFGRPSTNSGSRAIPGGDGDRRNGRATTGGVVGVGEPAGDGNGKSDGNSGAITKSASVSASGRLPTSWVPNG